MRLTVARPIPSNAATSSYVRPSARARRTAARSFNGVITTSKDHVRGIASSGRRVSSVVVADGASYNYSGLAVSGATVYYGVGDANQIHSVPTTGGSPSTYATSSAIEIIADATYVYWTDGSGNVYRCAKASCTTPTALATQQNAPLALAQDAVSIYWANYLGGEIRRLAK